MIRREVIYNQRGINLNRVELIGRLAREPELRYTANGTAVAHLVLAVDRGLAASGQKEADFLDLVVITCS